jgi:SAM-dependent methyltransferase
MDLEKESAFFDQFEAEHGDYDVLGEGAYARLLGLFDDLVRPKTGERCIDLGCGTGAFTKRLHAFGLDLTGMDISPRQVERANSQATGETYVVGDITKTDVADESYDIAVYSGVLHHCTEREVRLATLGEARRILRPGGRVFAFDPSAHSPSMWLYRDPRSPLYSDKGKTENEILLSRQTLEGELAEAGFADVAVTGVSGITFSYVESGLARLILPLYNLYEQIVRYSPLENRLGTFLVSFAVKPR